MVNASEPTPPAPGEAPASTGNITTPSQLPPEALDLASKLFDLARQGSTDSLRDYIEAGIPPNLTNHAGDTLLMLASYHDRPDTVRMLLSKGADPNVLNGKGQSPIAGAVFKGYVEVVKILHEAGADAGAGHPTARDCAIMFKRREIGEILGVQVP